MTATGPLDQAAPARTVALAARFLLELALLVGSAVLASQIASGWSRWPAVGLAPIVVATAWGLLLSPKATISLPKPVALIIEAALFLGISAGLLIVGNPIPAVIGSVAWALDRSALALLQT